MNNILEKMQKEVVMVSVSASWGFRSSGIQCCVKWGILDVL